MMMVKRMDKKEASGMRADKSGPTVVKMEDSSTESRHTTAAGAVPSRKSATQGDRSPRTTQGGRQRQSRQRFAGRGRVRRYSLDRTFFLISERDTPGRRLVNLMAGIPMRDHAKSVFVGGFCAPNVQVGKRIVKAETVDTNLPQVLIDRPVFKIFVC